MYNENIKWNDISPPAGVEIDGSEGVIGETTNVVGFDDRDEADTSKHTSGYWYSYGDFAPMEPGRTYKVSVYVKTSQASPLQLRAYTCDNVERGRLYGAYLPVTANDGWLMLSWTFANPWDSECQSVSFNWYGLESPAVRVWLSSPKLQLRSCLSGTVLNIRIHQSMPDYAIATADYATVTVTVTATTCVRTSKLVARAPSPAVETSRIAGVCNLQLLQPAPLERSRIMVEVTAAM